MNSRYTAGIILLSLSIMGGTAMALPSGGASVYPVRPVDPQAVYLTPDKFPVKGDGVADDSAGIQQAIVAAAAKSNYGILFIPEGRYRISKTIYVPKAVRVIGYGDSRPVIVLGQDTPGYQKADAGDKGQANYLIWFTDRVPGPGEGVRDANAGTFYSALANVNLEIGDGNPVAVALRTHYAQHSFISHVDIHIGTGKAGIFDVGNQIDDVRFFGGDYGIYTTRTSPSWQFMMLDTYFEGQRKAAILSQEAGLTIVRMVAKNVPTVVETPPDFIEKLYMEDCRFENISGPAIIISNENNASNQINLKNVVCLNVPVLAKYRQSGKEIEGPVVAPPGTEAQSRACLPGDYLHARQPDRGAGRRGSYQNEHHHGPAARPPRPAKERHSRAACHDRLGQRARPGRERRWRDGRHESAAGRH